MKRPEKYNRDPSRDRRDNRDMNKYSRDSRGNRDNRDDCKSHDNGNWQQNNNKKVSKYVVCRS